MGNRYKVQVKVISQTGHCAAGHEVGDAFIIGRHTPAGMCIFAYSALDPDVRALKFGAVYPWVQDSGSYVCCCPDPVNPVVFELRRGEEE